MVCAMWAPVRGQSTCSGWRGSGRATKRQVGAREALDTREAVCHNPETMKLLRMKPGHGGILLAEGDVDVQEEERQLIEAFRRELDAGMWAAVPTERRDGRREAELVKSFGE